MVILSIESSTKLGSVAILESGKVLSEISSDNQKGHSEFLNGAVAEALKQSKKKFQDLNLIAVGVGPGSFTGIRVAVNLARTLAYSLNLPVFTATSLDILHKQAGQDGVFMINAFKNMVYFAAYKNGKALQNPESVTVEMLEGKITNLGLGNQVLGLGDGFLFYEKSLSETLNKKFLRPQNPQDFPTAGALAKMAEQNSGRTLDWKSIIPLYLRGSEAEEKLQEKNKHS